MEPLTHLGDFHPYGLDQEYTAERQVGSYEHDAGDGLVNVTLHHRAVDGTSRWVDLSSHRENDRQPLELLLTSTLEWRIAEEGSHAPRPGAPTRTDVVVVDGADTDVDFISLDASGVGVVPAGGPGMRIALVIERSTDPGWRDQRLSVTQVSNLTATHQRPLRHAGSCISVVRVRQKPCPGSSPPDPTGQRREPP